MYVSLNNDKFNVSYSTISQGDWFCHFLLQFYITQTVKYNRSVKTNSLNNCIISMKLYSVYTEYLQYVCMMGFGNCFVLLSTGRGHTCMLRYCDKKKMHLHLYKHWYFEFLFTVIFGTNICYFMTQCWKLKLLSAWLGFLTRSEFA